MKMYLLYLPIMEHKHVSSLMHMYSGSFRLVVARKFFESVPARPVLQLKSSPIIAADRKTNFQDQHDREPACAMNEPDLEEDREVDVVNAREAGCEAVYIPSEDRTESGHWHFAQKYGEGN